MNDTPSDRDFMAAHIDALEAENAELRQKQENYLLHSTILETDNDNLNSRLSKQRERNGRLTALVEDAKSLLRQAEDLWEGTEPYECPVCDWLKKAKAELEGK